MAVRARAHPNIALVKYWGKRDSAKNIPATPSLSITLNGFASETEVAPATSGEDAIQLNGRRVQDPKIEQWLARLRQHFELPPVRIESQNNFPTASGLASSASGFAALMHALNAAFDWGLDRSEQSHWARQASASAARSLFGGYATLSGPSWRAASLHDGDYWPLEVVVGITYRGPKAVSSTVGMEASRRTSPYFEAWTQQTADDFQDTALAIRARNFDALAELVEASCLRMHALMLATTPPLLYWQPGTLAAITALRALRGAGVPVCYTIDAGPQIKAICLPEAAERVAQALEDTPGVESVHRLCLGPGAHLC